MDSAAPYRPRFVSTAGDHAFTNRLADATSPYLLQHAHNPVDWYAWGAEAIEAARAEDKPVFLSVGYSTCYWCHVMERESFENESVAAVMNEHFVCIKVDREERPDVDDLYMAAVQLFSNGHGGWPMSVFLEPGSLRPFYAGTYFPPQDTHGRPGFVTLLERVAEMWRDQRDVLLAQSERAASAIREELHSPGGAVALGRGEVDAARVRLLASHDEELGGFGSAPKFPQPGQLQFLLETSWDEPAARGALLRTLDAMAMGGIHDQVGGGFHRYSTDARWLVPHFEKMLYDNGQLAELYARAYELTGDAWYGRVLRSTLDYVLREMTDPSGRYYSAQDAEVDASEGASYVWTREEFDAVLEGDLQFAVEIYGLDRGPNFRDPHDSSSAPVNVLYLSSRPDPEDFARIDAVNRELLNARNLRRQPMTDDKTLTAWNGLMIAGMAEGARVLGDRRYLESAKRAARFILEKMRDGDGGLLRSYREGRAAIPAFLEDYAFLVHGLLRLHAATGDGRWIDPARELVDEARQHFANPGGHGWYDLRSGQDELFVRVRSRYDGATPAASSQMLVDLLALHDATGNRDYLDQAGRTLASMSQRIGQFPTAATVALRGLDRMVRDFPEWLPDEDGAIATGPVSVSVTSPVIDLDHGSGSFELFLDIREGFHVNAHDAGPEGVAIAAVGASVEADYPAGDVLEAPWSDAPVLVHTGRVRIPVRVQCSEPARARILVRWQACDDRACLAPSEEILPVVLRQR